MYKKAGIVICALILILEVAIFFIVKGCSADKASDSNISSSATTTTTTVKQITPTETAPTAIQTTTSVSATETSAPATETSAPAPETSAPAPEASAPAPETSAPAPENPDTLILINPESIPKGTDIQDIGTVVGKKVYVRNGNLLTSVLINTTTCGQLEWFGTLTDYNMSEGARVKCNIRIFRTEGGSEYKALISVTLE